MADITELERRITAALDRIGQGLDDMAAASVEAGKGSDTQADDKLIEELKIERATNERLSASREKLTGQMERIEAKMDRLRSQVGTLETENARLQTVIDGLGENNAALRAAGGADADAAVTSLEAELAELKTARAQDLAQLDDALGDLQPLLKEA